MYVCVCNAVTECQVHEAIGAGATTVKALSRQLGVGTQCGMCIGYAKEYLSKAQAPEGKLPRNVFSIAKTEAA